MDRLLNHNSILSKANLGITLCGVFTAPDFCSEYNGGCHQHADCLQAGINVTCSCKTGYSGDGIDCSPIDKCTEENGGCSDFATCIYTGPVSNLGKA